MPDLSALLPAVQAAAADAVADLPALPRAIAVDKGPGDFATAADLLVERRLQVSLARILPGAGFLGEEMGGSAGELTWLVDPIDGTVNWSRGLPTFGVQIALMERRRPLLSVISLPALGEMYGAISGTGAWCNERPLRVAADRPLADCVVAAGDYGAGAYRGENEARLRFHGMLARTALRVRMTGSAAVDWAWVASGRIDAAVTIGGWPWDVAAGRLLVTEAGGDVMATDERDDGRQTWVGGSREALATISRLLQDASHDGPPAGDRG